MTLEMKTVGAAMVSLFLLTAGCGSKKEPTAESSPECTALKKALDEADDAATVLVTEGVTKKSKISENAGKMEAASKKLGDVDVKEPKLKEARDKRKKQIDGVATAYRAVKGDAGEAVSKEETAKLDAVNTKDMSDRLDVTKDVSTFCVK